MSVFVVGAPSQYRLRDAAADENLVAAVAGGPGGLTAFVSSWRVHFWRIGTAQPTPMGSTDVPGCGHIPSHDVILAAAWHPSAARLVVSTRNRRLLIIDHAVPGSAQSFSSLLSIAVDITLEHGVIARLKPTAQVIVTLTSSGSIVAYSWANGSVCRVIQSSVLGSGRSGGTTPIVDFDFSSRAAILCMACSDGTLTVARSSSGALDFAEGALRFDQSRTFPIPDIALVALNPTRHMAAVCGATLSSFRFISLTGAALVEFGEFLENSFGADHLAAQVSGVAWNAQGISCVVALRTEGIAVFHHSGALCFTSFSRFTSVRPPSSRPLLTSGCRLCTFTGCGDHIIVAEPASACFEMLPLGRLHCDAVTPTPVLVSRGCISLYCCSNATEKVSIPPQYLEGNGVPWTALASPDGQHALVAADNAVAVYSLRTKRWRMFGSRIQEKQFPCACPPCWIGSTAVALPVPHKGAYAVAIFSRALNSITDLLELLLLPSRPCVVRSAPRFAGAEHAHTLCIIDETGLITTADLELRVNSLTAPRVYSCVLITSRRTKIPVLQQPVVVVLDAALISGPSPMVAVLTSALNLVLAPLDGTQTPYTVGGVFAFWLVSEPRRGASCADFVLALHTASGLFVAQVDPTAGGRTDWIVKRHTLLDAETVPCGVIGTTVVCAAEGARHLLPRLYPHYYVRYARFPLTHYFTYKKFLLDSAVNPAAVEHHLLTLQHSGDFSTAFDLLVHAVVQNDLPIALGLTERLDLLRRIVHRLRGYSDYYDVVVNCVRKGDVSFWKLIFDVVGAPHVFLEDCVTHARIRQAVYFVRVLLMERPDDMQWSLEQSAVAAKRLLAMVIASHDFLLAYELLRFIALLVSEINLPPVRAEQKGTTISAIESMLRAVWPLSGVTPPPVRQITASTVRDDTPAVAIRPAAEANDVKRHEALHRVLVQHPLIRDMIDIEAQVLLRQGNVIQVVRLFETFSFDLAHFMGMRYAACASSLDFAKALHIFHQELGIPLPYRGALQRRQVQGNAWTTEIATETQEFLERCPATRATIASLADYLTFLECRDYAALLHIVLRSPSDLARFLAESPQAGQALRRALAEEPWSAYQFLLAPGDGAAGSGGAGVVA